MGVVVTILLILFIPVCLLLILMVLLQAGKGGGLSGAFGGTGAAQPFLGARGTADFLSKLTVYLAIGFMALSLVLSILYGTNKSINIKEEVPAAEAQATDAGGTADTPAQQPATAPDTGGGTQTPASDTSGN